MTSERDVCFKMELRTEYVILVNPNRLPQPWYATMLGRFNDTIHVEKARTWKRRAKAWRAIERWNITGATVIPVTVTRTVTERVTGDQYVIQMSTGLPQELGSSLRYFRHRALYTTCIADLTKSLVDARTWTERWKAYRYLDRQIVSYAYAAVVVPVTVTRTVTVDE